MAAWAFLPAIMIEFVLENKLLLAHFSFKALRKNVSRLNILSEFKATKCKHKILQKS